VAVERVASGESVRDDESVSDADPDVRVVLLCAMTILSVPDHLRR
jgi:hypothetical protein